MVPAKIQSGDGRRTPKWPPFSLHQGILFDSRRGLLTLRVMLKRIIVVAVFLLLSAPGLRAQEAKKNALTPEEAAQGWILLFDGKNPIELLVEGDSEIVDGVLVIGGNRPSRVEVKPKMGHEFELRMEYRTEGAKYINVAGAYKEGLFGESGSSSTGLERRSKNKADWIEIIFNGKYDQRTDQRFVDSQYKGVGDVAFIKKGLFGGAGARNIILSFDVPAGNKFFLRNLKLKTNPVPRDPLWLIFSISVAALAIFALILLIWFRRKKGTAPEGTVQGP